MVSVSCGPQLFPILRHRHMVAPFKQTGKIIGIDISYPFPNLICLKTGMLHQFPGCFHLDFFMQKPLPFLPITHIRLLITSGYVKIKKDWKYGVISGKGWKHEDHSFQITLQGSCQGPC